MCAQWERRCQAGSAEAQVPRQLRFGQDSGGLQFLGRWGLSKDHCWSNSFLQTHSNTAKHEHRVTAGQVGGPTHLAFRGPHGNLRPLRGHSGPLNVAWMKNSEIFPCWPSYDRKVSPQRQGSSRSPLQGERGRRKWSVSESGGRWGSDRLGSGRAETLASLKMYPRDANCESPLCSP